MSRRDSGAEDSANETDNRYVRVEWIGDQPASITVVEAIADLTERRPTDLPPLHDSVDTEALDRLMSRSTGLECSSITTTFEYVGMRVRIDTDQGIDIFEITDDAEEQRRS